MEMLQEWSSRASRSAIARSFKQARCIDACPIRDHAWFCGEINTHEIDLILFPLMGKYFVLVSLWHCLTAWKRAIAFFPVSLWICCHVLVSMICRRYRNDYILWSEFEICRKLQSGFHCCTFGLYPTAE